MTREVLTADELEPLAKKILSFSKSEWAEVSLESGHYSNLRYAANTITTSGASTNTSVNITAVNGKRAGSVSTNDLTDDGLRRAVKRAEEIAQLAPENQELMPPRDPKQNYIRSASFDEFSTDPQATASARAKIAESAIKEATARSLQTAGFLQTTVQHRAYRNTKGLFVADRSTRSIFSTTMRSENGDSSGWNKRASHAIGSLDANSAITHAVEKCLAWHSPKEIDPGVYAAVLEPSAAADMIQQFVWALDARSAEEGRSVFSRPNGKTALGEEVVSERVHIYSDPAHPIVPAGIFHGDGAPAEATDWIFDGKLRNHTRSRFWANKTGQREVPGPSNLIMDGGQKTPEQFLYNIKEGLLITSFWYIRDVDDQTLLKTGLTRDGLFWVEDGQIKHGVYNFRWNESPVNILKNIVDLSRPVVTAPRDGWDGMPMLVPAIHTSHFNLSSISDAV
jgi:predicted Zn-dependent protease